MLFLPYQINAGQVRVSQTVDNPKFSHKGFSYTGIDFDLERFDSVLSMAYGEIVSIYDEAEDHTGEYTVDRSLNTLPGAEDSLGDGGYGNYVTVLHTVEINGELQQFYATYAHFTQNSTDNLQIGDIVEAGDFLGYVGWTGLIRGDHLHIQVGLDVNVKNEGQYHAYADGREWVTANSSIISSPDLTNADLIDLLSFDYGGKGKSYADLNGAQLSLNGTGLEELVGLDRAKFNFPVDQAAQEAINRTKVDVNPEFVITFDDILSADPSTADNPIDFEYAGISWDNFNALNSFSYADQNSGYFNGTTSGEWVAFNSFADDAMVMSSADDFDFVSAMFTAAWNDGLTLEISAYDDGNLVGQDVLTLDTNDPILWMFGSEFSSIDEVRFSSYGGTNAGLNGAGEHFAMDDLTIIPPDDFIFV